MDKNRLIDDEVYALYIEDSYLHEDIIPDEYKYESGSLVNEASLAYGLGDHFTKDDHEEILRRELNVSKSVKEDNLHVDSIIIKDKKKYPLVKLDGNQLKINMDEIEFFIPEINFDFLIYSYKYYTGIIFDINFIISLMTILDRIEYYDHSKEITIDVIKDRKNKTFKTIKNCSEAYSCDKLYYVAYGKRHNLDIMVPYRFLRRTEVSCCCVDYNRVRIDQADMFLFFSIFSDETIEFESINYDTTHLLEDTGFLRNHKDIMVKRYGKNKFTIIPNPFISLECLKFILDNFCDLDLYKLCSLFPPIYRGSLFLTYRYTDDKKSQLMDTIPDFDLITSLAFSEKLRNCNIIAYSF